MMVATRRASDALKSAAGAATQKVAKALGKQVGTRNPIAKPLRPAAAPRVAKFAAATKHRVKVADAEPLIDLGALEECELLQRPSARNKSPYVADVRVLSTGITAIAHCPNLDSGGKCVPGTRLLCSRRHGIQSDDVGPFGTPKCELVIRLLRCHEPEHHGPDAADGVWVSAHPALTESLTLALLRRGSLDARLATSPVDKCGIETQRSMKRLSSASVSGSYRPDYRLTHKDGSVTILEVKQVVDTDYNPRHVEARARLQAPFPVYAPLSQLAAAAAAAVAAPPPLPCAALKPAAKKNGIQKPVAGGESVCNDVYKRVGIFPWGKRTQKGPEGHLVVSARAIDHIRELAKLAETSRAARDSPATRCAVLFVCGRGDVTGVRANGAACPTFAKCTLPHAPTRSRTLPHALARTLVATM
jgi:hypothetical protein